MSSKLILIIKTGSTYPHIAEKYGDFEDWIITGTTLPKNQFEIFNVISGITYPNPELFSSIFITGSHENVTRNPPWMEELILWLHTVRTKKVPILGICFGHQLLAHAYGGKVDYSPIGRELGSKDIVKTDLAKNDTLFRFLPEKFLANESHSQSIVTLPPGAQHLAGNSHTKYQAFVLDEIIWGVQFHPEFIQTHMQEYINIYKQELSLGQIESIQIKDTTECHNILQQFVSLFR